MFKEKDSSSINFDSKEHAPIKETLEFDLYLDSWKKFTLTQTGAMRCESYERVATGLRRISWETIGSYAQGGRGAKQRVVARPFFIFSYCVRRLAARPGPLHARSLTNCAFFA